MIPLDSPEWAQLRHAYGAAEDIPGLLRDLSALPPNDGPEAEPYFSLWSALCHQGDAYSASYAAVPHITAAMARDPTHVPWTLFLLVASIEIARHTGRGPALPEYMRVPYEQALRSIPALVGSAAAVPWDRWYCSAALAALAVAKGYFDFGEALLELDEATVKELLVKVRGGAA
jgi:hypothetical protein